MSTSQLQDIQILILAFTGLLFSTLSMVGVWALDKAGNKSMWGSTAVAAVLLYYIIPLSSIFQVVKHRDASSIYLPLGCCAILNGGCWTIYGLAIGDINIWPPNLFGVVIGGIQVALRIGYGAKMQKPR